MPEQPSAEELPPPVAARFHALERIGAGGMGVVYRGRDTVDGELVAMKFLLPHVASDPDLLARFAREGEALRTVAHPNIVRLKALQLEPPAPCIVMEYIAGGTLADLLRREGRLTIERVLEMAIDLADALARVHRLGVVHRDLKPANILMAHDGTPRLSDFGLVRGRDQTPLTAAGAVMGTPAYMSPEAWRGSVAPACDLWSLGMVLYEMLAGTLPAQPIPDIRKFRPDTPAEMATVIARLLEPDPQRRLASARDVALTAERLLARGITPANDVSATDATAALQPRAAAPSRSVRGSVEPLIGREREIGEIVALLDDPAVRLVTLSGPGGSGKTRIAAHLRDRFDDAVFVDLTQLTDPAALMPAVAHALGVEEDLYRSIADLVRDAIRERQLLLILDNFEQILGAAPEVAAMLEAAPRLRVVVTSRTLLRIRGEHDYAVPPLDERAAAELFAARARAHDPRFAASGTNARAISEACERLDRLPLAIELAAARLRILSLAQLLEQLSSRLRILTGGARDLDERQRTLRATLDWSHHLLSDAEKVLFRRLAVFAGSFTLESVLAICGDDAIDVLQSLVDASLVGTRETKNGKRFRLLETIREYALEALAATGEAETYRRRHAAVFVQRAEELGTRLSSQRRGEALAELEEDHDNFRAAYDTLAATDPVNALRLAASLGPFRHMRGYWEESLRQLGSALDAAPEAPAALRAAAQLHRGRLNFFLGAEDEARTQLEDGIALARAVGDPVMIARMLDALAQAWLKVGRDAEAVNALREALPLARQSRDAIAIAEVLTTLGTAYAGEGDYQQATESLVEGLARARSVQDGLLIARALYYLGGLSLLREDPDAALRFTTDAMQSAAETGDASWAYHLAEMHARSLIAQQRAGEAAPLIAQSLEALDSIGSRTCLPHALEAAARLAFARERVQEGAAFLAAADEICRSMQIAMLPLERALLRQTSSSVPRSSSGSSGSSGETPWSAEEALIEARRICRE